VSEQGGSSFKIDVGGDISGSVVFGNANVVSFGGSAPVDVAGLIEFAREVRRALPALDLSEERRGEVADLAAAILRSAEERPADTSRLRGLGSSLRAIVEGAAAGALGTTLLSLWTP